MLGAGKVSALQAALTKLGDARGDLHGWATEQASDIAGVRQVVDRDDTGIDYEVRVTLRSLQAAAVVHGDDEDSILVWRRRVHFGSTDATVAGGTRFVLVTREQEAVASEISAIARGLRPVRSAATAGTVGRR